MEVDSTAELVVVVVPQLSVFELGLARYLSGLVGEALDLQVSPEDLAELARKVKAELAE